MAIEDWLKEPQTYCQVYIAPLILTPQGIQFMQMTLVYPQGILDKFDFLIDGRAKKQIEVFIKKKPKFEEICKELEVTKFK